MNLCIGTDMSALCLKGKVAITKVQSTTGSIRY